MEKTVLATIMWHRWGQVARILVLGWLLVLTASCSDSHVSQKPFADLHLPYVAKVPGVEQLELQSTSRRFLGMTTYQPSDDPGQPHILFGVSSVLYDVRLDGSACSTHPFCGISITVTPDGRWAACDVADASGVVLLDLTQANGAHAPPLRVSNEASTDIGSAIWAPDGRHLAVLSGRGGCSIEIYTFSPETLKEAVASLAVVLPLPQFVGHGLVRDYCTVNGPTWSPDGRHLAFGVDAKTGSIYTLSLASVWPILSRHTQASFSTVTVTPDMLRVVGTSDAITTPIWRPHSNTLTFTSQFGNSIEQVDVSTGLQTTILTQHVTGITHLSWTPDGKHLVFALEGGETPESTPPPAQLYVYSPPI